MTRGCIPYTLVPAAVERTLALRRFEDDQVTTRTFIYVAVSQQLKRYLELRIVESTILAVWRFARLATTEVA
jgi:hypothetical protein